MKARFQPDSDSKVPPETTLIDPEAYDASEQQFAASLEGTASRFVVEAGDSGDGLGVDRAQIASKASEEVRQEKQEKVPSLESRLEKFLPRQSRNRLRPRNPRPRTLIRGARKWLRDWISTGHGGGRVNRGIRHYSSSSSPANRG